MAAFANPSRVPASESRLAEHGRDRVARVLHGHIQQLLVAAKLQAAAPAGRQQNEGLKSSVRLVSDLIDLSFANVGDKEQVVWILMALEAWPRLWISAIVGRCNYRNVEAGILDVL